MKVEHGHAPSPPPPPPPPPSMVSALAAPASAAACRVAGCGAAIGMRGRHQNTHLLPDVAAEEITFVARVGQHLVSLVCGGACFAGAEKPCMHVDGASERQPNPSTHSASAPMPCCPSSSGKNSAQLQTGNRSRRPSRTTNTRRLLVSGGYRGDACHAFNPQLQQHPAPSTDGPCTHSHTPQWFRAWECPCPSMGCKMWHGV